MLKILKYITPLRISTLYLTVWTIIEYHSSNLIVQKGGEPGLGGIAFLGLGGLALISLLFDLIFSFAFATKPKLNWLIQIMIIIIFWLALHFDR